MSKTTYLSIAVACSIFGVVGCSRSEKPAEAEKVASKPAQTQMQTQPDVDCVATPVNTAISNYVTQQLTQTALTQAQQVAQQAGVQPNTTYLQNAIVQASVSLQTSKAGNGQCQSQVAITLPQGDIDNANRIYERLHQPNFANQLMSKGYRLEGNTLVADNQQFSVKQSDAGLQVEGLNTNALFATAGQMFADSALTQAGQNGTSQTQRNTVTLTPASPAKRTEHREVNTTKAHVTPKPKPTTNTTATTSTVTTSTNTTTTPSPSTEKPKEVPAETPKDTAKTSTPSESSGNKADTKPKAHSGEDKFTNPVDDGLKLTIEEKNEQY
ncbi:MULTISPECIES: hypothetical protein [unclassified Moraxella]|uniref:hypothetical protein n=1 Tax=unclassified Moraxella TaxID=2685852 RepID=UPI003AF82876